MASLTRRKSRKALAALAMWIGLTLVVGMLTLSLDVGDKMNRELLAFGANIRLEPVATSLAVRVGGHNLGTSVDASYVDESSLAILKTIFWRNNILGIVGRLWSEADIGDQRVPVLGVWIDRQIAVNDAEPFKTGARKVYGHWKVTGAWPNSQDECLIGAQLARKSGLGPGDQIVLRSSTLTKQLRVTGIVTTGEREDGAIVTPLATAQALSGLDGQVSEADVSALTTPENILAEKYRRDPESLTPVEYERWYCTPYPGSVAAEIQKEVPGVVARVVRRVSETQGAILKRIDGLIYLLAALTLVGCCMSVAGVLAASILERRSEVALLQAIGAEEGAVWRLLLVEAGILGLLGGALAAATGPLLGQWLVQAVFGAQSETHVAPALLAPLLGILIAWTANLWPVRRTLRQSTAHVINGN